MLDVPRNVAIFNETRDRIALAFDLDKDDQAVIDTASGETNLEELLAAALREARMAGEMAEGAKRIIDATRARQERLKLKAESLRKAVSWALAEAGLQKITAPDLTASLGHGRPKKDDRRRPIAGRVQGPGRVLQAEPRSNPGRDRRRQCARRCHDFKRGNGAYGAGALMIGRPKNTSDSFWKRVAVGPPDECWPWRLSTRTDTAGSLRTGSGTTPIA